MSHKQLKQLNTSDFVERYHEENVEAVWKSKYWRAILFSWFQHQMSGINVEKRRMCLIFLKLFLY